MNSSLVPVTTPQGQVPALVAAAGERARVCFLEFFAPTSATRTRGGPMLELQRSSWPGARAPACRRSAPCSRFTSPSGS